MKTQNTRHWFKRAAIVFGLFAVGGATTACGHHGNHGHARAFVEDRIESELDDLDATDKQREEVQRLVAELFERGQAMHSGRGEVGDALIAEWSKVEPDAKLAHAVVDAQIDALRKLAHGAVDSGLQLHQLFDSKQRAALAARVRAFHGGKH